MRRATTYDSSNSRCRIYTYRSGLLSPVGHDLELTVGEYRIEVDDSRSSLTAKFSAASVQPVDAVKGRTPQPGTLSDKDKRQIAESIEREVLEAERYPTVRFSSTSIETLPSGYRVRGKLELHGKERDIEIEVQKHGSRLEAEVELHQPDFGIEPYRAFGGALKVKPDVFVAVSVPAPD